MIKLAEISVDEAQPAASVADLRLVHVLAQFAREIEDEAVAIAKLLGSETVGRRHVNKAVVNILHHHRLGETLKELLEACDDEHEVPDEDWDDDEEEEFDEEDDDDSDDEAWDLEDRVTLVETFDG